MLSKQAAAAVISRLESAGAPAAAASAVHSTSPKRRAWDAHLMAALEAGADWTEYGVYAAGTCLAGLLDKVHVYDPDVMLYDPGLQEDGSGFRSPAVMAKAFDPGGRNVFVVLQSIGGSDAVQAAAAMYPHLKPV